jgi:sugar phosphate isomerase/epimerase
VSSAAQQWYFFKPDMKKSIVLSVQPTQFQAATISGGLKAGLAQIAALGYDGVELAIRDPKLVDADELVGLVGKHHLEVPAIGTGQAWGEEGLSFTDPDPAVRRAAVERVLSHIPLAARFKAVIIIGLVRGTLKPGVNHDRAFAWMVEALRECCQLSGQQSVRLALEPLNQNETKLVNTVQQGMELIRQVGAENFGLLLDTYHMNMEETNVEASILKAGKHIYHFHLADSNRWYPGAGNIDFKSVLGALQKTGYAGYISGEFLPLPDAQTAAAKSIEFLRSIKK